MIDDGDYVLLRAAGDREYFARAGEGKLHTDLGIVDLSTLIGIEWGASIESHLGKPFYAVKPRSPDFFKHMRRTGAPMMPKDIGVIMAYTGVCPDDTILDAGTGSGVLAVYLGKVAKKVITYEANESFANSARKNVVNAGLTNVDVRHGDILQEIKTLEGPFDVVTLDMQEAAQAIPEVKRVLVKGGFVATYSPFFEQAIAVRNMIDAEGFEEQTTIIVTEQELEVGKRGTRPSTRVGHTGFITIARK